MSTIKLKGKASANDDSWVFRFMLNKQQACDDFKKYFPDKNLADLKKFKISERNVPDICALWSMFPSSERLVFLKTLESSKENIPYRIDICRELTKGILMQSDMSLEESEILMAWISFLHPIFVNKLLHYAVTHYRQETLLGYLKQEHVQDVVVSYFLLNGNSELQEAARNTITHRNMGNSLQVLQFAVESGVLAKDDNDLGTFVSHFRNGKIHPESIRLLKKYKKEVMEALQPEDKIFTLKFTKQHGGDPEAQAQALAIFLMHQKDPNVAVRLLTQCSISSFDLETLLMMGPIIYKDNTIRHKYVCSLIDLPSYYSKKMLKHKIQFLVKAPPEWKEELKAELVLRHQYHSTRKTGNKSFENVLYTYLGLANLRTQDMNLQLISDVVNDTLLKIPNAKAQLSTFINLGVSGNDFYALIPQYNDINFQKVIEQEETDIFI